VQVDETSIGGVVLNSGSGAPEAGSTEYPYFLWVDQFDALDMGTDTVIVTGTSSDSMLIFYPGSETFSVFRMPYPSPFYTRGLDGRIDDADAGWKGRGIWATVSFYLPKFSETGMGSVNHYSAASEPAGELTGHRASEVEPHARWPEAQPR